MIGGVIFALLIQLSMSISPFELRSTPSGVFKGHERLSEHGKTYFAYKGIPYAKPPIGELRFKDPVPLSYNSEFPQLSEPPVCIQKNYLFSVTPTTEGQEDCLYLNVYVPKECYESNHLCPVVVFIHWGGFIAGRSTTGYLGPEYLMDRKLVLVTFNYRLGPFGFLSTLDDEAPGNYGLKDQVAVLKWVRKNIHSFAGNHAEVTISGQSAGAGSVHYHLLSAQSRGLFAKAISHSGNAMAAWAFPYNTFQKLFTNHQATFVGCGNHTKRNDSRELIKCLRSIPAEKLMDTQDFFRTFYGNPVSVFGPVIEKRTERNTEPFITKSPVEYILKGEIAKVPWLTGAVSNEGVMKVASLLRNTELRKKLNSSFEELLSGPLLIFALSTTDPHSLYKNISSFYFAGKEYIDLNDKEFIQGLIDLYTDRAFTYPIYQTVKLHSCKGHTPIYLYNFEYVGSTSYGSVFAGPGANISFNWGNCHCDELIYLFKSPDLLPEVTNRNDQLLREYLLSMWTNFATHGDPNPADSHMQYRRWHPVKTSCHLSNTEIEVLTISGSDKTGPKVKTSKGFYKKRMDFWAANDIFENTHLKETN